MVRGRGRGSRGASRGGRGRATTRGARTTRGGRVSSRGKTTRGKTAYAKRQKSSNDKPKEAKEEILNLDVNKDATEYFTKNATFDQHYDAQLTNKDKYVATLIAFEDYSIEIIPNAKARSLAAAFARHDKYLVQFLLSHDKQFSFVEVLKAITILDSQREKRSIEKKIERVAKTGSVMKAKKLGVLKNNINNLEKIKPKVGSCSGALARFIKKWVRKFTEKELEFFALNLPTEPWKKLANIVHLNPSKDLPNAPWFLPYCFGEPLPKDSKVDKCKKINAENVNDLIKEFDLPYSFVKPYQKNLTDESKEILAKRQEKLDMIIWYYEELNCQKVDDIIRARLENGDKIELGYGKLMERLLMFKDLKDNIKRWVEESKEIKAEDPNSLYSLIIPFAERGLKNFKASIASPVAVIGDASGSMSVAIRTATIISSLLTAICSAKLSFFNTENFHAELDPKSIADVLEVAYKTQAEGGTAPAASLVPYYDNKEIVKTFVIVTDEEENADGTTKDGKRWRFFDLFMEYRKTVYPSSLIFVSFLSSQHSQGQMYRDFVRDNVPDVLQFKFDGHRPDLQKLDSILGSICSRSSTSFAGRVEQIESEIKQKGFIDAFKKLKTQDDTNNNTTRPTTNNNNQNTQQSNNIIVTDLDQDVQKQNFS